MRAPVRLALLATLAAALLAGSPAEAKFRLSLALGDSTPAATQPVTVVLRSAIRLDYDLELVAVAPGRHWYAVVVALTGDREDSPASLPRDGFRVPLVRVAPDRWRGVVSFPRKGTWRLLVPNWGPVGFAVPPPLVRRVTVG